MIDDSKLLNVLYERAKQFPGSKIWQVSEETIIHFPNGTAKTLPVGTWVLTLEDDIIMSMEHEFKGELDG
jgi:hypothetical protein